MSIMSFGTPYGTFTITSQVDVRLEDAWWLVGLVDGEGSFYLENRGGIPKFKISLKLTVRNKELLDQVVRILGCGKVFEDRGCTKQRNAQALYRVDRIDELAGVVVPFFHFYTLRSSKQLEYLEWRKLVLVRHALKGTRRSPIRIRIEQDVSRNLAAIRADEEQARSRLLEARMSKLGARDARCRVGQP